MSESELTSTEARWRNYQKLIWTQQQIHLQIQQQQQQQQFQNQKMNGIEHNQEAASGMVPHAAQAHQGDMQNKPTDENPTTKETTDPWDNFDAQQAFLGPNLWDKRLPYDGSDFKLEYMDLEEFLSENGIPMDPHNNPNKNQPQREQSATHSSGIGHDVDDANNGMTPAPNAERTMLAGPSRIPGQMGQQSPMRGSMGHPVAHHSRSPSPSGSASSGISHDMGSDTSPESQNGGKPIVSFTVPFSVAELALGAVPGHDFDPRTRSFTEDELKPQPMIKKSRKQFVPDEAKDTKYWARRRKNNMAAKRSRDARRVKENQIAMRACFLEKENLALRQEMDRVQKENMLLKEQLRCCRRDH